MSWTEELIRLYDKNVSQAGCIQYKEYVKDGKIESIPYVLLPTFHTTVVAHVQVVLSDEGDFIKASQVEKNDSMTIIPVTEKSGARTSGKAPHPLCDNLKYLAGDYGIYVQEKGKPAESYYEDYMEELEKWHLSPYTCEKIDAIYSYLKKKSLIQDLVHENVLQLDENGFLANDVKIGADDQKKAFIRFIVRGKDIFSDTPDECWKDKTLQDAFICYMRSLEENKELDYLTGEYQQTSYLHSKKIRNEGDGAKLISSNDETNFTFRGRFENKEQAFSIGNEASQKMHNALKWIIRKQGRSYDTLTMVTWESNNAVMPAWDGDTESIVFSEYSVNEESGYGAGFYDSDENVITTEQFYQALDGYRKHVNNTSRMILMAFDAATTGRLCMAEYKELDTARYLDNIKKWHKQCGWMQYKFRDGKKVSYYGVPGIRDIADILYGIESNGRLTIVDKNGKKLYGQTSKRLLPCIWDGRNIPIDLVNLAVNKASMPQSYKERYNWERVLALACSFVKKSKYERNQKEDWNMALNEESKSRDYLYGRLLAVADRIEYRTYEKDKDTGRVTNAKRYMNTFSQRPFATWKIIEENLQPYLNKMQTAERRYYENILDSIFDLFDEEEFQKNEKLDGLYLLGFHSQSYELKKYKKGE